MTNLHKRLRKNKIQRQILTMEKKLIMLNQSFSTIAKICNCCEATVRSAINGNYLFGRKARAVRLLIDKILQEGITEVTTEVSTEGTDEK